MRVLLSSVGTRGDVQPALALALELRRLRREVRMCVPPNFVDWATGLGFEARPVGIEMRAPRPGVAPTPIPDLIKDQFDTIASAAEGCDLIVGGGVHQYAARSVAELRGIACVATAYAPVSLPSPDLAPAGPVISEGATANLARWEESKRGWNTRSLERVNANRARLGQAPLEDVLDYILTDRPWLAADAALAPAPSMAGKQVVQTGAWILRDKAKLAPELEAFLDAGEPPVYLGLGSMPTPEGTSRTLVDAARAVGRRVILSRGWSDMQLIDGATDCIAVGDVNQQALFPRVAAVVHHGGAGTTTAAAQAGAAQVATPMFSDQFYFANRIRELGIGSSAPFAGLSADGLAAALHEALKPEVEAKARAFAANITPDGAAIGARRLSEEFG